MFLYFFLGGGGWWGWARVSDFFFTKIPDLKNKYFLRWGGGGEGFTLNPKIIFFFWCGMRGWEGQSKFKKKNNFLRRGGGGRWA